MAIGLCNMQNSLIIHHDSGQTHDSWLVIGQSPVIRHTVHTSGTTTPSASRKLY